MDDKVVEKTNTVNEPSLHNLKCPHCGANDFKILGAKGSKGKSAASGAFGAVGALVMNAISKDGKSLESVNYKCVSCRKKFTSLPLVATPDEILSAPCKISFKRMSGFMGMAVSQTVWLNGIKIASVGNGKTIEFQTMIKYNTLFVTDQSGVAFKGDYKFEAQPNGSMEVKFKRKFKNK